MPIRRGTSNVLTNLSTLITVPNNLLQGEFKKAGENTLRFAVNTTLGILGIFDPASGLGFAELEKLNLSFDAWLYHPQIDDLTDLAQNFPGTTIILDHCGGPLGLGEYARESTNVFASWRKSIEKLAACRNVRVKLGGLGMRINGYDFHEKHLPPTSDELVKAWFPYFDTCIQAFGPYRCMFESNFPVDKGSYSYPIYWNACKKFTNDFNIEDREYLFSKTAAEVYRVDL